MPTVKVNQAMSPASLMLGESSAIELFVMRVRVFAERSKSQTSVSAASKQLDVQPLPRRKTTSPALLRSKLRCQTESFETFVVVVEAAL